MNNLRRGSKRLIKDINKGLVLRQIKEKGPISRSEISRNIDLGLSTITKICDKLLEKKLIYESGEGVSTGGRKPINLVFNNKYGYIIGIKIEEERVIMALTDLKPEIIDETSYNFAKGSSFSEINGLIIKGINKLKEEVKEKHSRLFGIGIAVSGIVDHKNGRLISSSLLGWENINFKEILEEEFSVEVRLDNDVNCYALAQKWLGKGKYNNNFVSITIGEGIGAGIILNNKLYTGAFGGAGEIGHMIINARGNRCYCGQRGCLETYASDSFIINYVRDKMGRDYEITEIINKANEGNEVCREALKTAGEYIGYGLINVIMHFNPEKIILGGKEVKDSNFIIPHIKKTMDNNWFNQIDAYKTELVVDNLWDKNFLHGSSILILSGLLEIPIHRDKDTLVRGNIK